MTSRGHHRPRFLDSERMRPGLPSLDTLKDLATPTLRLGVTGLSRAGKTVFITALVRNLTRGGRLPFFAAMAQGRVQRAYLEPQPDDTLPRFDYERHLAALARDPPEWPDSTRRISQLRVTVDFETTSFWRRQLGTGRLHIDIIDYPGEWLIDLAMMSQSYADWCDGALALAREPDRAASAKPYLDRLQTLDPAGPQDELTAVEAASLFTAYLTMARAAEPGLSTLGPGRFLMPGDLEGSPLLSFAPLDLKPGDSTARGSLGGMMARRYESYRQHVVTPFFRDHFSRLDRQIVLVDALTALNSGRRAVDELTFALEACLKAFRPGHASWLAALLGRRIDKILFAATKADHLHHTSHDRLEAALRLITGRASERCAFAGAEVGILALAALRSTEETEARQPRGEPLPCIEGVPLPGERVGGVEFDGRRKVALFPGDLPEDPAHLDADSAGRIEIVRFRPRRISDVANGGGGFESPAWPHIRLDRALEFLLGDRLA